MATAESMDIVYRKKGFDIQLKVTGFTGSGVLDRTNLNVARGYIGNTCQDFYE